MKTILICLSLIVTNLAFSQLQSAYYKDYDWKETPEKYAVNLSDTTEDEIILFEKKSIEYYQENNESFQLMLNHTITLVKTDAAIEGNNRMYINNEYGDEVVMQKARVIKPDGSTVVLKQEDIKESKDEDGEVEYRYFALDGLEKGCVIEYLHYIKRIPDYTGSVMVLQGSSEKKKVEYDIISPKHLDILIYPVNNMPEFVLDSTDNLVRRKSLYLDSVKALKNEYQSPYLALLQKCYYKLNKNYDSGNGNFYNYNTAAKILYENMFTPSSKGAIKKMKALVKDMETNGGANLDDKIRYLEHKLKSEYNVLDYGAEELQNLDFVFEKKITSKAGMTKLLLQTLREGGVKVELVLTSDRDENPFITEFEGYNFLDQYLLYVNDLDMYLAPDIFSRLGFPPYETTNNKGLFIQEKQLNDMMVPISKVKEIKLAPSNQSVDMIIASVDFSKDALEPAIEIERTVTGYKALYPQAILDLLEEDKKLEVKEELLKYIDKESKLENVVFKNDASTLAGKAPFSAKATFVGSPFIETAGDNILLKVGMLIGPQAESYNKDKRTLPVQTEFAREYNRTITVILPDGMSIKNLSQLNMDFSSADGSTGFKSTYVENGNQVVVTISEYYQKVYYPVEEYQEYEDVINAAADFNKIVLVLEKK